MRFGYRRLTAMLVREGMPANHKRVYRLYREEGVQELEVVMSRSRVKPNLFLVIGIITAIPSLFVGQEP